MCFFFCNSKKDGLSLRRALLLMYDDDRQQTGGHNSTDDTVKKLQAVVWRPSFQKGAIRRVLTCADCWLTAKPQKGLSAQARSELHERPARMPFIGALGPIPRAPGGNTYTLHT
jgi:hypothetical protein